MTCSGQGINPKSLQMSNMFSSFFYPFFLCLLCLCVACFLRSTKVMAPLQVPKKFKFKFFLALGQM
jgi:uncharacterized membrane protein